MTRPRITASVLPAVLLFVALAGYLSTFADYRVYAAYDDRRPARHRNDIVGFYQLGGWPCESYAFAEGKLPFLREPRSNYRLELLTWEKYLDAYGHRYDTGMTGAWERWKAGSIAINALVAVIPSVVVAGLALLWVRSRAGKTSPPPHGKL